MDIRFDGKRALVTGAGKGIGREIAKALVKGGAETYALSRTKEDLDSLKAEVTTVHTVLVDLSDWDATRKAVEAIGPIDLLVNNAGVALLAKFVDVTPEEFDRSMNVNLKAVFNVSQVVVKGMMGRGVGGAIVNMSSAASHGALHDHAVYCSSKAGLDMLTKVMALELGPGKIRVNAVNPTVVMTAMGVMVWGDPKKAGPMLNRIPFGKFVAVEDVVNAVLFLLSDKAAMIHGTTLPVDGGLLVH